MAKNTVWRQWLKSVADATRPAAAPRPTVAPRLTTLDDRIVPTQLAYGLFDTSVDSTGAILTSGADSHYSLTVAPNGVTLGPATVVPKASTSSNGTGFVGPAANGNGPAGVYEYTTTFTIPAGTNLTGATLSGLVTADDDVAAVLLNGTSTGTSFSGANTSGHPFSVTGLQTGLNTLTVRVNNGTAVTNPTDLKVANLVLNVAPPASQQPPVLTGSGSAVTVTANGPAVAVDPNLTVSDPSTNGLSSASVSIATNQTSGDVLAFTAVGNITGSYNSANGILTLSGADTAANYQTALRSVTLHATAAGAGPRSVSFSIAPGAYNPANGHFYQFVSSSGINWGAAEAAASGKSIFGLQGYLATPRSVAENNFAKSKAGAALAWLGMSDSAAEGYWQRVTGPDAGIHFYQGNGSGNPAGAAVGGLYNNWNSGEPNNSGGSGEDYAHFLASGLWNDYAQTTTVAGYIVEYGGSPNDPTLQVTSSATATVVTQTAAPTVTTPAAATVTAATAYTVQGAAPANSLVQVYNDANNNGVIDAGDTVVASQQLTGGATAYSVSTPLATNARNHFLVTATVSGSTESNPVAVPTITQDNLAVTTTSLPAPTNGQSYSQAIATTGGSGSNAFAVASGALPPGLSLNTSTGVISGTPTTNGAYTFTISATDSQAYTATSSTLTLRVSSPLAVTTAAIAPVSSGVAYSQPIATTGGRGPTTFAVTAGALPAGLTLNPTTGVISGTPTTDAAYSFAVTATDADGRAAVSPTFTGTVTDPLAISTTTLPNPTSGQSYSETVATTGGESPVTFAVTGGALPPGLSLNPTTGEISGTPTTDGSYGFTVTATDPAGRTAAQTYSDVVSDPLTLGPATLPAVTNGEPFAQTETTTGGRGAATYAVTAGALPVGLSLDPTTGAISGTPTTDGPYTFTVTATDQDGRTASQAYAGTVADPLAVTTASLPNPTNGQPYSQPILTTGGESPTTFAVTAGALPAGLTLDPATGELSGTPTTDGPYTFTVTATDPAGRTASQAYSGVVSDPLTLGPAALSPATSGEPFSQAEATTGGRGSATFAVTGGSLPAGLSLDPATGAITGTPTTDGPYTFTVTATDVDGRTASQTYSGQVYAPLAVATAALAPVTVGQQYSQPVLTTGGDSPTTFAVTGGSLPAGLTLDPATGVISGTPTATGPFSFTVTATDADGRTASKAYAGTGTVPVTLSGGGALPAGTTGVAYSQVLAAAGGESPLTYAVTAGALPAGLTLDPATGAITGTPTTAGAYSFTVTATDARGRTGETAYTMAVANPLTIGGGSLTDGTAGAALADPVTAAGGTAPITYAVTAGALPPGTALTATGTVGGVPKKPGTYTFTVTATDALGRTAARTETVTVRAGSNLSTDFAVAAGDGGGARVRLYDRATGAATADFFAFEPTFRGGANVAVGDVNGDGVPDVVVAAGGGGAPRIIVIDGTKLNQVSANGQIAPSAVLADFFAFDETLRGGASVALARLDSGLGLDIVVGAGAGGGPRVRTFALTSGAAGGVTQLPGAIGSFFAFAPTTRFGVTVAAGNLDGTGVDDVIVGMGAGGAPQVAVFRADGSARNAFTASNLAPLGGASVAAGYLDGTAAAQLVVGTGPGGPPLVNVYTGVNATPERTVTAFESSFTGGVSVNSGPVGEQSAIFLGAGQGGGPRVRVLTPNGVQEVYNFFPYESSFHGGVNVG